MTPQEQLASLTAVLNAVQRIPFRGTRSVHVTYGHEQYTYTVPVQVSYNVQYRQMDVEIEWRNNKRNPDLDRFEFRPRYTSNFTKFQNSGRVLKWQDGLSKLYIDFA